MLAGISPVVKAFVVRYPSASAQSIQNFYDRHEVNRMVMNTVRAKAREGDLEAVEKAFDFNPVAIELNGIRAALADHSRLIHMIHQNPELKPDEKRQLIDTLYFRMIELARAGNEILKGLRDGN